MSSIPGRSSDSFLLLEALAINHLLVLFFLVTLPISVYIILLYLYVGRVSVTFYVDGKIKENTFWK